MPTQKELKERMALRELEMALRVNGVPIDEPPIWSGGLNKPLGDKDLQKRIDQWDELNKDLQKRADQWKELNSTNTAQVQNKYSVNTPS